MKVKLILFLLLFSNSVFSQLSVGISIGGIGYHPIEDDNSDFYKWKISKKTTGFASLTFLLSYRINDYVGVKAIQTVVLHDCAGKPAGVSHFGIDLHDNIIGWENQESQFSVSFGPLWYYRKNWIQEPTYTNNPDFMKLSKKQIWESKFVWHGGQIEYAHSIDNNKAATINILLGYPYLYTFSMGYKYSLN